MPSIHETAAQQLLTRWMSGADGAKSLHEVYAGMQGRWDGAYADAIGQSTGWGSGSWPMEQVACAGVVHSRIVSGEIGIVRVRAPETPNRDAQRAANAAALSDLPPPFSAEVFVAQSHGSADGQLRWAEPVEAGVTTNPDALAPGSLSAESATGLMSVRAGQVPLEIGSTKPSRTLLHLGEDHGVARWAYNSEWIWVLIDMNHYAETQPYVPALRTYTPRNHFWAGRVTADG